MKLEQSEPSILHQEILSARVAYYKRESETMNTSVYTAKELQERREAIERVLHNLETLYPLYKQENYWHIIDIRADQLLTIGSMLAPSHLKSQHNYSPPVERCLEIAKKYPKSVFSVNLWAHDASPHSDQRYDLTVDTIWIPVFCAEDYRFCLQLASEYLPEEISLGDNVCKFWWD